jgi:predicted enzyme related to lactoylglutathione lyase
MARRLSGTFKSLGASLHEPITHQMITGIMSGNIYATDYRVAQKFYGEVLGLERGVDMDEQACFFQVGANKFGIYLEGGAKAALIDEETSRASFTFEVESASALYARLQAAGVHFVQTEPRDMTKGHYWFQFYDPSGNILEAIGGK